MRHCDPLALEPLYYLISFDVALPHVGKAPSFKHTINPFHNELLGPWSLVLGPFSFFGGWSDCLPHALLHKVVIIAAQMIPWSQICIEEYEQPIWASVKIVADDLRGRMSTE